MKTEEHNDNSRLVLALILIGIGVVWVLKRIGIHFEFPAVFWENAFYPLRHLFHNLGHFIFSWPMILVLIGGVLLAGKRPVGLVLVIVGGIFLIPKIFFSPA